MLTREAGAYDKIRELFDKESEFFNDKTERHDPDARPYPRKERPFIRHVNAAVPDPGWRFIFLNLCHRADFPAIIRLIPKDRENRDSPAFDN